jgi:hypothetical protein
MTEGPRHTPESGPSIPLRTVDELSRIVHETRVLLAEDERFKEAFTKQVLKKHTEPRQFHRIRHKIMASVIKKVLDAAAADGKTVERFRDEKSGRPVTSVSPYVYGARSQEEILVTAISLLANPPSKLDRHPEGFLEAWKELALAKMRESA